MDRSIALGIILLLNLDITTVYYWFDRLQLDLSDNERTDIYRRYCKLG